jgi:hypothetical protein
LVLQRFLITLTAKALALVRKHSNLSAGAPRSAIATGVRPHDSGADLLVVDDDARRATPRREPYRVFIRWTHVLFQHDDESVVLVLREEFRRDDNTLSRPDALIDVNLELHDVPLPSLAGCVTK